MSSYEYGQIDLTHHKRGYDGIVTAQKYTPNGLVTFLEGERCYSRVETAIKNMEQALALRGWERASSIFRKALPAGEVETHKYRSIFPQTQLVNVGVFKKEVHGSFQLFELSPDGWKLLKTTAVYIIAENTRYPEKKL